MIQTVAFAVLRGLKEKVTKKSKKNPAKAARYFCVRNERPAFKWI
jgi:hypothetical protein